MAIRLLKSALEQPDLTQEIAIAIMSYHLRRNRIARNSHRKTWLARHKDVEFKVVL